MAAHNEELQGQYEEEAKKCHSKEVYTFITVTSWLTAVLWVLITVSIMLSIQSQCKRMAFSIQELETDLDEITARTEELGKQLDEKTKICCLIEVPSSCTPYIHACKLH